MTRLQTAAALDIRTCNRGLPPAARFIGTCGKCKAVHVFNGETVEGRIDGKWKCGWRTEAGEFIPENQSSRANCAACGKSFYGVELRRIAGRVVDHKCGAKCRNSRGHVCDCSCGGKNHGAGFEC